MSAMQFWGVEVKAKESCKVNVEEGSVIHLSQATLGELKKDADPVVLYVKVGDKKLVLGILTPGNNPQLAFDLVFDTEFEISHNWKNGSVHVLGYQSELPEDDDGFPGFSDEDEEDIPVPTQQNGKPSSASAKKAEKLMKNSKPKPEEGSEDDSDGSDEEEESDDDSDDAKDMSDMMSLGDDSEEDEDDSDESSDDEEPAKPAESGKKRAKPEAKTPDAKKAKLATPQKTDGKKGGHDATPHPSKKGGKTPGTNKSPKSGAQVSCDSCKKIFSSEVALQSHSKAKHGGK